MAYTITITSHDTYIDCTVAGTLTFENMLGIHYFLNMDHNFRQCRRALFDLRDASLHADEGNKEIMKLAMRIMNSEDTNSEAKIAFIAQSNRTKQLVETFAGIFDQSYLDIKLCNDESDAFEWLG